MKTIIPNLKNTYERLDFHEEVRQKVGTKKFDRLSRVKQDDEIQLTYLAKILVQAYFDYKHSEKKNHTQEQSLHTGQDTIREDIYHK